ncbi:MAG: tRNA uridine(34) 5-carboxymethylaminomethyl modification radical SAM/GNAT enzyme Elp3 [Anaerolineaceae bacterium]|nr:tRNA uridine(34) 5-carboxymethylaminomethyl modification radical SAM/GNAT enzyme Elp3 [Anaerolineaceae bacterium]
MPKFKNWEETLKLTPDKITAARRALAEIQQGAKAFDAIRHNPLPQGGFIAKHTIVAVYQQMVKDGEIEADATLMAQIRSKPIRTLSGVTTVTVLTKPYPCPGECIFCPSDVRMPKSYLPDEPGAARAYQNDFDPFAQVSTRIESLEAVGHPTDKIELLILGGSWDAYPHDYQEWFLRRCFDAMNKVESNTLADAQVINETATHRNVGLVIETRPDLFNLNSLKRLRELGVTKVQMGAQSMDDRILTINRRGHSVSDTLYAAAMLRAAGFKFVIHWMPNLLGATLESDRLDFHRLWTAMCPDEIKIYPTQLLEDTILHQYWKQGEFIPYTTEELTHLIADIKPAIPPYCRVNRIIRDIPSPHVVDGNKRTSLRQDIQAELSRRGQSCQCIRCREVRGQSINPKDLLLQDTIYHPFNAEEHFLSYVTPEQRIAGYLRLSLPGKASLQTKNTDPVSQMEPPDYKQLHEIMPDLAQAAIIREIHVYGQSLPLGEEQEGAAQHIGIGTRLLGEAEEIARQQGYKRLAVISAIGTRRYYESRGFKRGELYQFKDL